MTKEFASMPAAKVNVKSLNPSFEQISARAVSSNFCFTTYKITLTKFFNGHDRREVSLECSLTSSRHSVRAWSPPLNVSARKYTDIFYMNEIKFTSTLEFLSLTVKYAPGLYDAFVKNKALHSVRDCNFSLI